VSVLFDLSPFTHFQAWGRQKKFQVSFETITADGGNARQSVFACRPETGRSPTFLAPCSPVLTQALTYYLTEVAAGKEIFEKRLPFEEADAWSLQVTLGHLFREETFFDFTGGRGISQE
jgi:hypothetical protein